MTDSISTKTSVNDIQMVISNEGCNANSTKPNIPTEPRQNSSPKQKVKQENAADKHMTPAVNTKTSGADMQIKIPNEPCNANDTKPKSTTDHKHKLMSKQKAKHEFAVDNNMTNTFNTKTIGEDMQIEMPQELYDANYTTLNMQTEPKESSSSKQKSNINKAHKDRGIKRSKKGIEGIENTNISSKMKKANDQTQNKRTQHTSKHPGDANTNIQIEHLTCHDNNKGFLHDQPWAKETMYKYTQFCNDFELFHCEICHETWPSNTKTYQRKSICKRCMRDKKKFSSDNCLIPSPVPEELQNLTMVEKLLISRVVPIMKVYIRPGGQRAYKGHCINIAQNTNKVAKVLPNLPSELSILTVAKSTSKGPNLFQVHRHKVWRALLWLKQNNPFYNDVFIDNDRIIELPESGELDSHSLSDVDIDGELDEIIPMDTSDYNDTNEDTNITHSFIYSTDNVTEEEEAIRQEINKTADMNWPTQNSQPVNEYKTPGLATMAYPWLFPDGKGDPTLSTPLQEVTFLQKVQHLLKYADLVDGKPLWRFANDPTFPFWALDRWTRWSVNNQAAFLIKQNPSEALFTAKDLKDLETNSDSLCTKITRYLAKIPGSPQYWHSKSQELKAIAEVRGPSHMFYTVSWPDTHNPHFHRLCGYDIKTIQPTERRQNVINNGHLADWLFVTFMRKFITTWQHDLLMSDWTWYRFEFQHRGSVHLHGMSRLKYGPNLPELNKKMVKAHAIPNPISDEDLKVKKEGEKAEQELCSFADWLVDANNPNPPPPIGSWSPPETHPCQTIQKHTNDDRDYQDLCNMVQTHSCEKNKYCMRKKGDKLECRFGYPKETHEKTHIEYETKV